MPDPAKNQCKKKSTATQDSVSAAKYRQKVVAARNGNSLLVAKAVSGKDAVAVLQAAGILNSLGKLNPRFA